MSRCSSVRHTNGFSFSRDIWTGHTHTHTQTHTHPWQAGRQTHKCTQSYSNSPLSAPISSHKGLNVSSTLWDTSCGCFGVTLPVLGLDGRSPLTSPQPRLPVFHFWEEQDF